MFENAIDHLNREREVSFTPVSETSFEGYVNVRGERIKLCIELGTGFPKKFPTIRVVESKRFIPHVSDNGSLCLFNTDSVIIKPDSAEELLLDSYDRAVEIIMMDSEKQKQEVFREFFAYWNQQPSSVFRLYMNLPEPLEHEFQEYTAIGEETNRMVVANSIDEAKMILVDHMHCSFENTEKYHIPVVRIRLRSSVLPPKLGSKPTWKAIRSYILDNITGSQKRNFNRMLSLNTKVIHQILLLAIPSSFGDQYACMRLHHINSKRRSAIRNTSECQIDVVPSFRIDKNYLLVRGGAEVGISSKSVLLIGCGSVGGFLAENLCQCGIGVLDILDKDILSVENVHRHVLGFNDAMLGKYKADLMKTHLEERFPYVEIDSLGFADRTAETFLEDAGRLKGYDLIVSATGNPTIDLMINDTLYQLDDAPPFVTCFNEPYGIGGHAVAVFRTGACLRCLYSDPISGELTQFLGSFVEPGQSFLKSFSGCAGSFVEYSVLDSQQTAIITSRLIIEALNGTCSQTRMESWLGSAEKLRSEGFKTSVYYEELEQSGKVFITRNISRAEGCKTCGS